jgi:hypothetical protein
MNHATPRVRLRDRIIWEVFSYLLETIIAFHY